MKPGAIKSGVFAVAASALVLAACETPPPGPNERAGMFGDDYQPPRPHHTLRHVAKPDCVHAVAVSHQDHEKVKVNVKVCGTGRKPVDVSVHVPGPGSGH